MSGIRVEKWQKDVAPPTEQEAEARLNQEGYSSFTWYDVPGAFYPSHSHNADECIWIVKGDITFNVQWQNYPMTAGDRIYLPAKIQHTATVPESASVTYLVGQKKK